MIEDDPDLDLLAGQVCGAALLQANRHATGYYGGTTGEVAGYEAYASDRTPAIRSDDAVRRFVAL
jgi:hypothetical protein